MASSFGKQDSDYHIVDDGAVIVVGAGPVGTTAATALARNGIPVVLVETAEEPLGDWRASTFHSSTLDLLGDLGLGVVEQMLDEGLPVPRFQYRDRRDGFIAELDFGLLADETRFPFRLQLNQQHLVRMLTARLRELDCVQLRFGSTVRGIEQHGDGSVSVEVESGTGITRVRGSFVIGADGANSTVRQLLGVDFEGQTYPEQFVIVSTSTDFHELIPGLSDVNYVSDPEQWLFLLRIPESWRAVYPVVPGTSREVALGAEVLQSQLQGIAPMPTPYPILDAQIYNVHQRVAAQFRRGSVAIIGDAAHINSPLGGVGLNSGIHDALDLAARLGRIRSGTGDLDAELDAFAAVRRTIAKEYIQADTHRNTERMKEVDPEQRLRNQEDLRQTAADPDRARAWMRRSSLLESVQRYGIGRPPAQLADVLAPTGSPVRGGAG